MRTAVGCFRRWSFPVWKTQYKDFPVELALVVSTEGAAHADGAALVLGDDLRRGIPKVWLYVRDRTARGPTYDIRM